MSNETVFDYVADKYTDIYEVIIHYNTTVTTDLWDMIRWGVTAGIIITTGIIIILANITIEQVTASWADMKIICTLATIYVCAICEAGSIISAYVCNQRQRIPTLMNRVRPYNLHNLFEEVYKVINTHDMLVRDRYVLDKLHTMTCVFKALTLMYAIFNVGAFCSMPIGKIPIVTW